MTEQGRLLVVLLALLPSDGSLITTATLASVTGLARFQVYTLLEEEVKAGRVEYWAPGYGYRAVKQGGAL